MLKSSTAGDIIVNSDKVNKSDPNEHLQCPYCNDIFENNILIFNFHIYQNHKDKKKEYFRKLKRRELAYRTEKSKAPVSKTPRAPTLKPPQASATSEKPVTSVKNKRFRSKKEFIRAKALVPDIIRISNYISCNRMSSKYFKSSCKKLSNNFLVFFLLLRPTFSNYCTY